MSLTNVAEEDKAHVRRAEAFLKALGRQVCILRRAKGWTQEALAERAGVGMKHLGAVERGETNPTTLLLWRLTGALNVEPFELFYFAVKDGEPDRRVRVQVLRLLKEKTEKELQKIFAILSLIEE